MRHPDWINPEVELCDTDGNAFAVMANVTTGLRRAGNLPAVIAAYREEAMAGDYEHLLAVSLEYAG